MDEGQLPLPNILECSRMFSNVRTHAIVAVCGDMAAEKTKLVKFASYFVAARYGGGAGGGVEEGLLPLST